MLVGHCCHPQSIPVRKSMFQETIGGRTRRHGTIHPVQHSGREVPGPWLTGKEWGTIFEVNRSCVDEKRIILYCPKFNYKAQRGIDKGSKSVQLLAAKPVELNVCWNLALNPLVNGPSYYSIFLHITFHTAHLSWLRSNECFCPPCPSFPCCPILFSVASIV